MSSDKQYETNASDIDAESPDLSGGYMLFVRVKLAPIPADTEPTYPVIIDTSPLTDLTVPLTLTYFYLDPILGTIDITSTVSEYLEVVPVTIPPTAVPVTWPPPLTISMQGIPLYTLEKLPPYDSDTVHRFSINVFAPGAGNSPTSTLF